MKAHIHRDEPPMQVILELNRKFGTGYQAHMIMGENGSNVDSIIDSEPFTLYEAANGAQLALDQINREIGSHYELQKIMRVTDEAMRANKNRDFASAQMVKDIDAGTYRLSTPAQADYKKSIVDGKEEVFLSGRGVVTFSWVTWCDEKLPKAREAVQRYCEYLALHGEGNATGLLDSLLTMDKESGIDWIRQTYARRVKDSAALIQYVMG